MGIGPLDFRGKGLSLGNIFLVFTKLDTFCYLNCKLHRATCRRFDTIPACDRQTDRRADGQTDGIAVASTALAMPAVKLTILLLSLLLLHCESKKTASFCFCNNFVKPSYILIFLAYI